MKILAFDTSTEYCSVAIWADGELLARDILAGQRHSELLLPLVQEIMAERSLSLRDLDGIAFGCGPGSFTGLRIGCGVAQGLAFGANLPVIGISTLLAVAQGAAGGRVIACLDARMGEVYHAVYEQDAQGWREVLGPGLYAPQDAPLVAGDGWVGCGSGFAAYGDALRERYAGHMQAVIPGLFPQAGAIAQLAVPLFESGEGKDAALAVPLYIRNKVALKTSER